MRTEVSVLLNYILATDSLGSSHQKYLTITIKTKCSRETISVVLQLPSLYILMKAHKKHKRKQKNAKHNFNLFK
jgi:hypothetical protein